MITLADRLGLGTKELIAVVGAGGKTTTVKALGTELTARGSRVVVTTTTKMGRNQVGPDAICTTDPDEVARALAATSPLFVACHLSDRKVTGPTREQVDTLFEHPEVDHIVVEADGAKKMLVKAPAAHEPQIPKRSTTVIVVASLAALGRPISDVAHRPEAFARLAGAEPDALVSSEHVARVLGSDAGGLKDIPDSAKRIALLVGRSHRATERAVAATSAFDVVLGHDIGRDR